MTEHGHGIKLLWAALLVFFDQWFRHSPPVGELGLSEGNTVGNFMGTIQDGI